MEWSASDQRLMDVALRAAASAAHATSPNPMVGCVVARGDQVVAVGAHLRAGEAHAEVIALELAGGRAVGADIFVTLEPCAHQGRTPPCVERLLAVSPRRVVVAMVDPNPRVPGGGVERLRAAGIEVQVGLREAEARRLNEFWLTWVERGTPFVTSKIAMSLDGRTATAAGESQWITSEESRRRVHRMRRAHDAVLVGIGTVLADDPRLTARTEAGGRQPLRVVADSRLRIPPHARLLTEPGEALIATTEQADPQRLRDLQRGGVPVAVLPACDGGVDVGALLRYLGERDVVSVLAEAGARLQGSLFDAGAVDRLVLFVAPCILGGDGSRPAVGGRGAQTLPQARRLRDLRIEHAGPDLVISGYCVS